MCQIHHPFYSEHSETESRRFVFERRALHVAPRAPQSLSNHAGAQNVSNVRVRHHRQRLLEPQLVARVQHHIEQRRHVPLVLVAPHRHLQLLRVQRVLHTEKVRREAVFVREKVHKLLLHRASVEVQVT